MRDEKDKVPIRGISRPVITTRCGAGDPLLTET
ncbi:MAG: hypothetical protein QOF35_1560 [Actinomycetota bacterium]|jgi:hypothetical protein|nr:hypothetical protein [Actinomycetota bacterium]